MSAFSLSAVFSRSASGEVLVEPFCPLGGRQPLERGVLPPQILQPLRVVGFSQPNWLRHR